MGTKKGQKRKTARRAYTPRKPKSNPSARFTKGKYGPKKKGGWLFTFNAKEWQYEPLTILGIKKK